jgi:hypothetical protein
MNQYLDSTTPGMVFHVYVYKPQGRPPYAYAVEGVFTQHSDTMSCFSCELCAARTHRVNLKGNNTAKNAAVAMVQLTSELREKGWIA